LRLETENCKRCSELGVIEINVIAITATTTTTRAITMTTTTLQTGGN